MEAKVEKRGIAVFGPETSPPKLTGGTTPIPPEVELQQIRGNQAYEGYEPYHQTPEELQKSVEACEAEQAQQSSDLTELVLPKKE